MQISSEHNLAGGCIYRSVECPKAKLIVFRIRTPPLQAVQFGKRDRKRIAITFEALRAEFTALYGFGPAEV